MKTSDRLGRIAIGVGLVLAVGASSALADAASELKCRRAIGKELTKFERTKVKRLQKCNDAVLKGKIEAPCPDGDTAQKIAAAKTKLGEKIAKACTDPTDVANIFPGGNCPAFGRRLPGADCPNGVVDAASIFACIGCIGEGTAGQLAAFNYGFRDPNPDFDDDDGFIPAGGQKALLKCQRSIGKRASKWFDAKRKTLQKCYDAVIKSGSGSCPDGDAQAKIDKALQTLRDKVEKDCTGFDQADVGGLIQCPGGDPPGPLDCSFVIHSRQDLIDCLECMNEYNVDCTSGLAAGVSSPECEQNCGNGIPDLALGETCDDGNLLNDDDCPDDCNVALCVNPGSTVTATVHISGPEPLNPVLVYVKYKDGQLSLPFPPDSAVTVDSGSYSAADSGFGLRMIWFDIAPLPNSFTIDFTRCNGAVPVDADFDCWVEFAGSAAQGVQIGGVTCSVDVP